MFAVKDGKIVVVKAGIYPGHIAPDDQIDMTLSDEYRELIKS